MAKEKESLMNLLLDIDSTMFQKVEKLTKNVNIFNVLGLERAEIRHSNVLAWLLDPNANHQLGSAFSKYFFYELKDQVSNFDFMKLLLHSVDNFTVDRESFHTDILLTTEDQLVCIENKIDSKENGNQLATYWNELNREYPNHEKLFLYLTPNEDDIPKDNHWQKVSYYNIRHALEKVLKFEHLDEKTKFFINDYLELIKGEIMNEETEIEAQCIEIYNKHKTALDLIIKYRPDTDAKICHSINQLLAEQMQAGKIIFNLAMNENKKIIRFTTPTMAKIFPVSTTLERKPWGGNKYLADYSFMYEIHLSNEIKMFEPTIANTLDSDPIKQAERENILAKIFNNYGKPTREPWAFYKLFKKKIIDTQKFNGDLNGLIKTIEDEITKIINTDIPKFEAKLTSLLGGENQ